MTKSKKKIVVDMTQMSKKQKKKARTKRTQELTLLGSALRGLGGLGGSALGGYFGQPLAGGAAGTSLGAAISRWLGSGDYTVQSNSLVKRGMKASDSIPVMHRDQQSVVISHKEFLFEVRSSTTFNVAASIALNPAVVFSFPWLSGIASQFQEYKFKGVVFHYVPTSGNAVSSTNNALGSVMMQTSYRATDAAPTSKVELLNEYWASEAVPSESFCHPIECDPKENPFNVQYTRSGDVPSGDSRLLYDLGTTHIAVSGQQASNIVLGDIWVSYEVELKKPVITSNAIGARAFMGAYGAVTPTSWFTNAISFGGLPVTTSVSTLTFAKGSVGTWFINYVFEATTVFTAVALSAGPTLTNCALGTIDLGGGVAAVGFSTGGTSPTVNRAPYWVAVVITDPSVVATVTMPTVTLTGTILRGWMTITQGPTQG